MSSDLTPAEESLWADDVWDFIQDMAARGIPCMVVRCGPGTPHVCLGKSQLLDAPDVLRNCADRIEREHGPYN